MYHYFPRIWYRIRGKYWYLGEQVQHGLRARQLCWRTWVMYALRVDTVIILLYVTNITSHREHKLDRLKSESKGAANEAPTCAFTAVPLHALQVICLGEGGGGYHHFFLYLGMKRNVNSKTIRSRTKRGLQTCSCGLITLDPSNLEVTGNKLKITINRKHSTETAKNSGVSFCLISRLNFLPASKVIGFQDYQFTAVAWKQVSNDCARY